MNRHALTMSQIDPEQNPGKEIMKIINYGINSSFSECTTITVIFKFEIASKFLLYFRINVTELERQRLLTCFVAVDFVETIT